MLVPNRHEATDDYRYGYNGMEKDDEIKGEGNSYTTEFRQYDPRIGRWLTIDPKWDHPMQIGISPYAQAWNNPIRFNDPQGDCPWCWGIIIGVAVEYTSQVLTNIVNGDPNPYSNINMDKIFIAGVAGGLTGGLSSLQLVKSAGVVAKVYVATAKVSLSVAESVAKQAVDKDTNGKIDFSTTVTDVALDIVPLPVNKFKLGKSTEKALKTTKMELDRATRLAKGTSKNSRKVALEEVKEKLDDLVTKRESMRVTETIVNNSQDLINDQLKSSVSSVSQKNSYSLGYYNEKGEPMGGGYMYSNYQSAQQGLKKEKIEMKAGRLPEGITEIRIEKKDE